MDSFWDKVIFNKFGIIISITFMFTTIFLMYAMSPYQNPHTKLYFAEAGIVALGLELIFILIYNLFIVRKE